ncbi:MAG TPA: MFS transporter, partial [Burkholderiales bacterium]|nr:MFS transporter [Burkholderiales bacterium]
MPLNLIFAVTLIGFIGVNASRVVLQLYSLELGATPTQVGMLVALYYVCPLLLSYPAGTWGDRYGPLRPLVFSAICGAGGLMVPYFVHSLPAL